MVVGHPVTPADLTESLQESLSQDSSSAQRLSRDTFVAEDCEEDVLGADELVLESLGLVCRTAERPLYSLGDPSFAAPDAREALELGIEARDDGLGDRPGQRHDSGHDAPGLTEQSDEKVLKIDCGVGARTS
jgi:hypothetical protein